MKQNLQVDAMLQQLHSPRRPDVALLHHMLLVGASRRYTTLWGGEDRRTPLMLAGTPGDRDGHDSYRSLTRVLLSNFHSSELL